MTYTWLANLPDRLGEEKQSGRSWITWGVWWILLSVLNGRTTTGWRDEREQAAEAAAPVLCTWDVRWTGAGAVRNVIASIPAAAAMTQSWQWRQQRQRAMVNFQHELIQSKHILLSALMILLFSGDDDDLFAIVTALRRRLMNISHGGLHCYVIDLSSNLVKNLFVIKT